MYILWQHEHVRHGLDNLFFCLMPPKFSNEGWVSTLRTKNQYIVDPN